MDDLLDEVLRFEESPYLDERQKVALRLHEIFLTDPQGLGDELREEALARFSAEQIVELTCKFVWWSSNKPQATIGPDEPHDPDRVRSFHYAEDGEYVVHAADA
jgi:hypothetical protein